VPRRNELGQPVGDPVGWAGARAPAPVVLAGRLVELRPLTTEHAQQVVDVLAPHPELWTYLPDDVPADAEDAARAIAAAAAAPDALAFAILDRASGAFLGRSSYLRIQPAIGSIEVGAVVYSPALRRTRAATEAQYLLMRHAFDELGYRRYEWKCDSLNAPSRAAAARLGFVEEGTWRNALVVKGRSRDTTWFSIVDGEWPVVGEALEAWLADANFDAAGRQRRSLADVRARLLSRPA
jgi:RimJ/RimL family protein N-acetyltransferase